MCTGSSLYRASGQLFLGRAYTCSFVACGISMPLPTLLWRHSHVQRPWAARLHAGVAVCEERVAGHSLPVPDSCLGLVLCAVTPVFL